LDKEYDFSGLIIGFYSNASGFPILSSSFVLPILTLSEILIDQCLDICFTSTSLYYSLDWCSLFGFCTFDFHAGHYSLLFILLTFMLFILLLLLLPL